MSIFDEPKIDCHAHILNPAKFAYDPNNRFHPSAGEIGTVEQLGHVMQTYGVKHVLLVQPNSGYGADNSYLLDAIAKGEGRFKGISHIPNDVDIATLKELKQQGILGAAINPTFDGLDHFRDARGLLEKLAELDMFANIQVQNDDLLMFMPWLEEIPVKVLIDHCGRPTPGSSLDHPGFWALMDLAETKRACIKISGFAKFSRQSYPFKDIQPYVRAIIDAYTPERCLWASDWPFLRPPERQDYGPLIKLAETFFPYADDRKAVFWDNPCRLFGFGK